MLSTMSLSTGSVCWITAFTEVEKDVWKQKLKEDQEQPNVKRSQVILKSEGGRKINKQKKNGYWPFSRLGCLCVTFTVPRKSRYSRVSAANRLAWLLERVCHCCSLSGRFGHVSNSMLDKDLHTRMWACMTRKWKKKNLFDTILQCLKHFEEIYVFLEAN